MTKKEALESFIITKINIYCGPLIRGEKQSAWNLKPVGLYAFLSFCNNRFQLQEHLKTLCDENYMIVSMMVLWCWKQRPNELTLSSVDLNNSKSIFFGV